MQRVIEVHLEEFRRAATQGRVVVMSDMGQAMTLDIILETVFGYSVGLSRPDARRTLKELIVALSPSFVAAQALRSRAYAPWRRFLRCRAKFDAWVDTIIAGRRERGVAGSDILGVLLEARYDDGCSMPDAE